MKVSFNAVACFEGIDNWADISMHVNRHDDSLDCCGFVIKRMYIPGSDSGKLVVVLKKKEESCPCKK